MEAYVCLYVMYELTPQIKEMPEPVYGSSLKSVNWNGGSTFYARLHGRVYTPFLTIAFFVYSQALVFAV